MLDKKLYISSDGTPKDTTIMDYTYLVNAIAKAYRVLNETEDKDVFVLNSQNINVLENELLERNKKYYERMDRGE